MKTRIRLRELTSGKVTVSWGGSCLTCPDLAEAKRLQKLVRRDLSSRKAQRRTPAQITGQRGGYARKQALSPERRTEIARNAGLARAEKVRQAKAAKESTPEAGS